MTLFKGRLSLDKTIKNFRFGKILIVQDVDAIDPILFPILRNDYVVQGDFQLSSNKICALY